jgi:hypothetical protein
VLGDLRRSGSSGPELEESLGSPSPETQAKSTDVVGGIARESVRKSILVLAE